MHSPLKIKKKRKVLVYLFGSLGDTIVAIPALRAVRRHFGDAEIVLLQNVQSGNIVKTSEVVPGNLVDRFLSYNSETIGTRKLPLFLRLWMQLRKERFESAVYLVLSERPTRSVLRDRRFFRLCGIHNLFGFHALSKEELYPVDARGRPAPTAHEAERKLERLKRDGIEILPEDDLRQPFFTFSGCEIEEANSWLVSVRERPNGTLIAIAPGCKTRANLWPLENFIEISRKLIAQHDCELIIIGGIAEMELGETLIRTLGTGINAAGKFTVRESAALLSLCELYIGLDTGTTHLAAAVGTPCFAIFHQRDNPGQWFPLAARCMVVHHHVECAGCRLLACPLPDHPCMKAISPGAVWTHLEEFIRLNNDGAGSPLKKIIAV